MLWKLGRFRFARFTEHDHEKNTKGEGLPGVVDDEVDIPVAGMDLTQPIEHATSTNRKKREAAAISAAGAINSSRRQHDGHEPVTGGGDDSDGEGHVLHQDVDTLMSGAPNSSDVDL